MDKTDREVMQQALEALETVQPQNMGPLIYPAKHALRARLAEPEPEPVAWGYELATTMLEHGYDGWTHRITRHKPNVPEGSIRNLTPLDTIPPTRPLTDEEILRLLRPAIWAHVESHKRTQLLADARAIERAHKITGGNDE